MSSCKHLAIALWCGAVSLFAAGNPAILSIQNRAGAAVAVAGDAIDLVGANFADAPATASGWPLPTTLGSTQVFCNGYQAPILSVSPGRMRIQLPWELTGLPAVQIRVVHAGVSSDAFTTPLAPFAPVILAADAASAVPGQTITLRAIGLGPRDKYPVTGSGPAADRPGPTFVRTLVRIGDVPVPITANALATGDPQNDAGVQTISVVAPFNLDAGDGVPVRIEIGAVASEGFPVRVERGAIRIALSSATIQVSIGTPQKLSATVEGSGDTSIAWSIDANAYGLPNNNGPYGFFQNGTFYPSSSMQVPNWTLVRATHASGAFATALMQIVAQDKKVYRIVPDSPAVSPGESVTLSLMGPDGSPVDGALWNTSDGFSSSGSNTYTVPVSFPPAQVNVWARVPGPNGYPSDAASTTILINPPRGLVTGTTPAAAHIGETITFQGSNGSARNMAAWFTTAGGSRVRAGGDNGIVVPHGAVSGPVNLELPSSADGRAFLSPPYQLTVLPRLRLHAGRLRVAAGETVQIAAAAPDVPGTWPLTWRADLGTVDAKGVFTAPNVAAPSFARIWACLQTNNECGTTIVEVLPLRLEPDSLIVNPGETVQLKARTGTAEVAATWTALTANVSVTASGKLTAGTGAFDGGLAVLQASYGGVSQRLEISIRTSGSVANTAEFEDWLGSDNNSPTGRLALGAFAGKVAVKGNWIYSLSRSISMYGGPWTASWMDVYQLDDRRNPVWVDAVEAPYNTGDLYVAGNDLYVTGNDGTNLLLRFDISGGRPVLRSRDTFSGDLAYRPQGLSCSVTTDSNNPSQTYLQIRDAASGITRSLPMDYVPISSTFQITAAATDTWAAVMFVYTFTSAQAEVVVFDITGAKAVPIAILPSGGLNSPVVILQDLLVVPPDVFRVSGSSIALVSQVPGSMVLDADPATKRILLYSDGFHVADLSDAAKPKLSAAVQHSQTWPVGRLGTDYFTLVGAMQSVAVYPIQWQAGVRSIDAFPASPWMNELRARDGYLYWTGPGWGFKGRSLSMGIFEVDDVSGTTAAPVATMDRPGDQTGWAIELNGHYAYVGTDAELIVYDIALPTAPAQVTVLPAPAISMALQGNYLYVGSNTGTKRLLLVYDVSNAARPKLVASLPLADFAYGLAAQPGWLAAAMGKSGMAIYSLANPAAPSLTTSWAGTVWGVAGDKNLLYAAADIPGMQVFDVTNLKSPGILLAQIALGAGNDLYGSNFPAGMAVSLDPRGIAWVCGASGSLYGLDVRIPARPRHVALLTMGGCAAANVAGNRLYVAGNDAAYDATIPQNLGLFQVAQPQPGQILPDRYSDLPPVSHESNSMEPLKARVLGGRESIREMESGSGRAFRRDRPPSGYGKPPRN